MKQFRKKDYKFRHDLGGICVDYNMDWLTDGQNWPNDNDEYDIACRVFYKNAEQLLVGEYFSMSIFGHKRFAYRDNEGYLNYRY